MSSSKPSDHSVNGIVRSMETIMGIQLNVIERLSTVNRLIRKVVEDMACIDTLWTSVEVSAIRTNAAQQFTTEDGTIDTLKYHSFTGRSCVDAFIGAIPDIDRALSAFSQLGMGMERVASQTGRQYDRMRDILSTDAVRAHAVLCDVRDALNGLHDRASRTFLAMPADEAQYTQKEMDLLVFGGLFEAEEARLNAADVTRVPEDVSAVRDPSLSDECDSSVSVAAPVSSPQVHMAPFDSETEAWVDKICSAALDDLSPTPVQPGPIESLCEAPSNFRPDAPEFVPSGVTPAESTCGKTPCQCNDRESNGTCPYSSPPSPSSEPVVFAAGGATVSPALPPFGRFRQKRWRSHPDRTQGIPADAESELTAATGPILPFGRRLPDRSLDPAWIAAGTGNLENI